MKIKFYAISLVVIGGLVYLSQQTEKPTRDLENKVKTSTQQTEQVKIKATLKPVASVKASDEQKLPQAQVLSEFKKIQDKIFKTEAETQQLKALVIDPVYLRDLTKYLLQAQPNKADQNTAIDFILESLKTESNEAAAQAIIEIVKDDQVENNLLPSAVRESLAGIKAELLFQASSLKPELFINVESLLPGPVSQKIWKNIQKRQAENAADSETERQARFVSK